MIPGRFQSQPCLPCQHFWQLGENPDLAESRPQSCSKARVYFTRNLIHLVLIYYT